MNEPKLTLTLLPGLFAVCQLAPDDPVPGWATETAFFNVTRTADELAIICAEEQVPPDVTAQPDWRLLKVEGPFDFGAVGILAALTEPLARAGIPILSVATYDTDYLLIQRSLLYDAITALAEEGHTVERMPENGDVE